MWVFFYSVYIPATPNMCGYFFAKKSSKISCCLRTQTCIGAKETSQNPHNSGLFLCQLFNPSGLKMNPAGTQIQEIHMLQFLKCLFGLHGATEIDHTIDGDEIKVCRNCLKEVK